MGFRCILKPNYQKIEPPFQETIISNSTTTANMNNDNNTCGSINVEGYLRTINTVDEYEKKYKKTVIQHVLKEIERTKKIFEKYNITWYGISGAEYGNDIETIMERFEEESYVNDITIKKDDGKTIKIEYVEEGSDLNELINKIKQGKIRIKKSK